MMKIPMTVSGGLQHQGIQEELWRRDACFNTDDGIGRATTSRSLQRSLTAMSSFNTDDGIGRATTLVFGKNVSVVSLFQYR